MGSLILTWWNLPSTKRVWPNRHKTPSLHLFHFLEQVYIQTWDVTETSIYELKCHQSQNPQATANKTKPTPSVLQKRYKISHPEGSYSWHVLKTDVQIWDNDFMKKCEIQLLVWGDCFRTDEHRGHFELEKRLKIKYSSNSDKYT